MTEDEWKAQWIPSIAIYNTDKYYCFKVSSGYILRFADPEVEEVYLEHGAEDEQLGQAILDTLKQSRFLSYEQANKLKPLVRENYPIWIKRMMAQYGYKNKTALFKNMKSCDVMQLKDSYKIEPTRHESLEGWGSEGMCEEDNVYIPLTSTPAEIGAALRLGFDRCKERYDK